MFGKSKKAGLSKAQADVSNGAPNPGHEPRNGELLLEQLFVEERPATKTAKFAELAEDAEFVDPKPLNAKSESNKADTKNGELKAKKGKSGGPGLLSGLFSKRASTPKLPHTSAPPKPLDLAEESEGLVLDIEPVTAAATSAPEPPKPQTSSKPSKPSKPLKAAKASKAKKGKIKASPRKKRASKDIYLIAELGDTRSLSWKVTAQGIQSVNSIPAGANAISFSREDLRFEVESRLSHSAAESLVLQEVGDAVHFLNRSKDLKAVYATLRARVEATDYRIGPGVLLIDHLVRERAPNRDALVVGFELKDLEGRDALLVLYYLSTSGRISEPQISVYPDNRDFLLSQFAATHQAARENAQILLLDHIVLFEATSAAQFYPNEPQVAGIPLRKVWTQAATIGVIAAVLSVGWAYQGFAQNKQVRKAQASAESAVQSAQHATAELLSTSPRALAQGLTLNVEQVLSRSHALWVPGSRVQLTADSAGVDYRVTLRLLDVSAARSNAASARVNTRAMDALLHIPTPADCERGSLNFAGTFNEAQLNIRCEAPPHPLDRYRDG